MDTPLKTEKPVAAWCPILAKSIFSCKSLGCCLLDKQRSQMSCLGLWLECDRGMLRMYLNTRERQMVLLEGGHPEKATTFVFLQFGRLIHQICSFVFLQLCSGDFLSFCIFFTTRDRWCYKREAFQILATTFLLLYLCSFAVCVFLYSCILHYTFLAARDRWCY